MNDNSRGIDHRAEGRASQGLKTLCDPSHELFFCRAGLFGHYLAPRCSEGDTNRFYGQHAAIDLDQRLYGRGLE
jgi:hypothetical protein